MTYVCDKLSLNKPLKSNLRVITIGRKPEYRKLNVFVLMTKVAVCYKFCSVLFCSCRQICFRSNFKLARDRQTAGAAVHFITARNVKCKTKSLSRVVLSEQAGCGMRRNIGCVRKGRCVAIDDGLQSTSGRFSLFNFF